jgi:hypothetical protein
MYHDLYPHRPSVIVSGSQQHLPHVCDCVNANILSVYRHKRYHFRAPTKASIKSSRLDCNDSKLGDDAGALKTSHLEAYVVTQKNGRVSY